MKIKKRTYVLFDDLVMGIKIRTKNNIFFVIKENEEELWHTKATIMKVYLKMRYIR